MILLLPAVTPVSLLSGSRHHGGFVGVLGLRIVVQVVAASLGLAVAAAAGNDETENMADLKDEFERLERREVEVLSFA